MLDEKNQAIFDTLFEDLVANSADIVAQTFSQIANDGLLKVIVREFALLKIDLGNLDQRMRAKVELLAKGGWYLHRRMNLGLIGDTAQDIESGEYQRANAKMIAFFEETYLNTKLRILGELPERSHVLKSAFLAHELGEYNLSVPVFLAQVDGICVDAFQIQAYNKKNKRPEIADKINTMNVGSITAAMLSPLATNIPLTANPEERKHDDYPPGALNRHLVIHGLSTDYGVQANSLKAISLLNHVCDIRQALPQ